MLQTFDDLEKKKFLEAILTYSVLETERGSLDLKKLLFQNSLKLRENTTYVTFGELEIQKKNASHFDKNISQVFYKED